MMKWNLKVEIKFYKYGVPRTETIFAESLSFEHNVLSPENILFNTYFICNKILRNLDLLYNF